MRNRILPFTFCLFTSAFSFSQSEVLKYAHQVVDTLASPSMYGRGYVNKGDSIAADYIKKEFEKFGIKPIGKEFEQKFNFSVSVAKKDSIEVEIKYFSDYQTQNILSYIKGSQYPDSFIVFSAHYDHLGQKGKDVYFPGANDNASGCAMLLNLAKYYSQHPPKYSVAFMSFGGEEVGLLGSKYYVEHPLFPLKQIKFLVNMDIMGTGDEGIKVVNATEHKKEFDELVKINTAKNLLPVVSPRGKAANSDHYFFEEAGVKTFFIYTLGGIKAYHDIYDRPETLPLTKFEEVYKLLLDFTSYLQQ
ncbi:MAG: M28 family peptidase [Bacteroidetes bacterium]|nr:M28 family peptidase [Bacteroidota bacterium]